MKVFAKRVAELLALLCVLPAVAAYLVMVTVGGAARVFPGFSQAASLLPGTCGVYLRRAFYRCVLPECGADAWIGFGTVFSHATVRIGPRTYVGVYCVIGDVTLEADVLVGSQVSIVNGSRQHGTERLDVPLREQPGEFPRVTIGRDSWIGERSVVLADVGEQSIVGAGAVVIGPLPSRVIAVGNPARVVRTRDGSAVGAKDDEASSVSEHSG